MTAQRAQPGLVSIAVPMLIWALHFVGVYGFRALACESGWRSSAGGVLDTITVALIGFAIVAFVALGVVAVRALRVLQSDAGAKTTDTIPRRRFLSRITLALCVISAIAVVYSTIPALLLPSCQ